MGLKSQAKFLRGPSTQPLKMLRAGQVQHETESHLRPVQFQHAYLQIPAVSVEDKILKRLQVMVGAMQNAPPPTSLSQLVAT